VDTLTPIDIQVLQVIPSERTSPLLLQANKHRLWSLKGFLVWPVYGVEAPPELDLSGPVLVEEFKGSKRMILVLARNGTGEVREVLCADERLRFHPVKSAPPSAGASSPALSRWEYWEYGHNEDGTESYVALPGHHVTNKDTDGKPFVFHMTFLAPSFEEAKQIIEKIKY
jgi:hypothetical protein